MAGTQYGQFVKSLSFEKRESGPIRQQVDLTGQFLGINASIRVGACWTAGKLGEEPYLPHVHDFDQIMFFLGTDMDDLSELGAEVETCVGEEMETHMITCSTVIAVPRGFPHFPGIINRLDKRILYMEVSIAPEYSESIFTTNRRPSEPAGMRSTYGKHFFPLLFKRKGAWTYGPLNRDDSGGWISLLSTRDSGIDYVTFYENIKKAPYRFNPDPYKPHAHPTTQVMLFLGTNTDDLSELGAEFEICLGKEVERHVFSAPTAVVTPPFLPHWPGGVLKCSRPILMVDVHPFGNEH